MIDALVQLPPLIAAHVRLSAAALLLALAIGLPLALAAAHRPRLAGAVLAAASLVQVIPGLALLALFYPFLLFVSGLVGGGVPALGFLPALLALTLYALLPIVRNTIAGLRGLDPAVRRAALGLGMTRAQRLRWVEAPLAAPVAMAGIRTAAVWTVGAATLATTVGYPSLGNPIFAGLQTENWTLVLAGCAGAAGLALAADALLALIERGVAARRPLLWALGATGLAVGCLASLAPLLRAPERTVVIGAKNFSEQYILARLIGDRLSRAGYGVSYREGLGSAVAFQALRSGAIDAYVDYAGTLWVGPMGRTDAPPPAIVPAIARWMTAGPHTRIAARLGFENAYALAVRPDEGLHSLPELAARAPSLTLGADLEFLSRPEWRAVRDAYGLHFAATRAYAPTFMYRALATDQADAISAFSSDGRIAADHLVVLADPAHALPRYDALLLVSPARANDGRFLAALKGLDGAVPIGAMRTANYLVDRDADKQTPAEAARWLAAHLTPPSPWTCFRVHGAAGRGAGMYPPLPARPHDGC